MKVPFFAFKKLAGSTITKHSDGDKEGKLLSYLVQIGELRSGSPRLEELNHRLRQLHKEGHLDVLSFSEVCRNWECIILIHFSLRPFTLG